ncbi:golgin subfamily B member 1 isoform X2 [Denticeps clupeoides]|uniref:golgin subfamily B member 1 isoform X2 n=1 Tax=Denticeps clupeoides TaxID=299321 RepID=UPI0010A3FCD6|nr:golgin subfamily B member 1-like isoform X2 [Denticeps clupeoides]
MLKWFSGEEAGAMQGAPGSPQGSADGGGPAVSEMTERLAQTEQLVAQLKELIREKDAELRSRDEQLKAEKESCEAKLSKIRLQNKAKVTSLNAQLEEFRKQQGDAKGKDSPLKIKRSGSGEAGDSEVPAASRGKILLLKKKVEELEHQLSQRDEDLGIKVQELEAQRERGVEMDAMLVERDRKLAEKEAYIVHLQMGLSGGQTGTNTTTQEHQVQSSDASSSIQELQLLVQSLTKKVGEGEERYSLLQEQADSLRALLETEKAQYEEKENMYKQNIQTFKDIILQKDNNLLELNQKHEQELFRLAAKSDASADLEQLLKALKQKLHEKEEVLLGKNQVVDVLQGEVDSRDQQIKELMERMRRLQSERENLQSKLEAEKHVMRAQLLDLMQKHEVELLRVAEKHEHEMSEKEQAFRAQLEESKRTAAPPFSSAPAAGDTPSLQRLSELEGQVKLKAEEASKSETKFLKMKAWSKSRIRQLEDELKKAQSGSAAPDVTSLRSRITELEEQRQEILCKLETYDELKARNDLLEKKLVVYEEQQRKMQADLEQVTKRAASQASESGSVEEFQSQVLEWQDMVSMVTEAEAARDQAREEKNAMALRMSHIEEEREGLIEDDWFFPGCSDPALANRQQELEEEMARERGLRRASKKLGDPVPRSIQEDFEFDGHRSFPDPSSPSGSTTPMEGENMGGWWPEYSTPDTEGLRSVVEELELERNQLQEQILALEERCQDLEDRRQLQSRIEALQNESERLQAQVSSLRSQQMREAEKHQLLVSSLNEQLKGLSDTQECLESSLMEKEHTLAKTSEKLELIDSLQDSLKQKEEQYKDVADKLIQTEHNLSEMTKKFNTFEKQCTDLKVTVTELTHKLSLLKEKTQKQEATNESLQTELDQTNEELDKLNTAHLEERAELIHDLQSCEREIDNLKDILIDKDKEINGLSGNMAEYADQIHGLKQEIKQKDEDLLRTENALRKAEREAQIIRETQSSDQQSLNAKVAELLEEMKDTESELKIAREQKDLKMLEAEDLTKQVRADRQTIQDLRTEIQKLNVNHCSHLTECEIQISSLKDQLSVASKKLHEAESLHSQLMETAASNEKLKDQLHDKAQIYEKELKSYKDEQNKLLAEVSKHKGELQSLSKQLEEQVQSQEQVERMVEEKLGLITSLEQKLKDTQKESEGERLKLSADLKAKDIEMDKMNKELADKSEGYLKLETQLDSLRADNQEVQAAFEKRREEFMAQKKLAEELSEKVRDVLEQNSSMQLEVNKLMVENGNLQQEIAEKFKSFSELMLERDFLLSKMGVLEAEHSEKGKIVDDRLLEKTNECNHLSKLLHESKMHCTSLQDQVKNTHSQVDHLNSGLEEKDKCIADQNIQIQTQQSQISQLQEQGAALKSGLIEKDNMLQEQAREFKSLQVELQQLKQACSELQNETDAIKKECSRLTQVLDEKESLLQTKNQDCQSHIDELNKRNESVVSLSSQLGNMNEVFVKLETENANLKASLASHVSDSSKLSEALGLRQEDIAALQNHVQTVTEQNRQLRSLFQIKEKEFVGLQQIVGELDNKAAGLLEQNSQLSSQICSLTEQNEKLGQERDEKCKQISDTEQENVALERKLSGLELQHSENRKIIEGLMKDKEQLFKNKETISENLLEKTNECSRLTSLLRDLEENSVFLKEQADSANTRANNLESTLAEKEEEIAEKNAQKESQQSQINQHQETLNLLQEQGRALKSGLMEKDLLLQQKAEEHSSLLAEIQQQKDTFSKLQNDMDTLKSECSSLSQNLEEKDMIISSKNQECQSHMDELTKRNESVFSLSGQLADINENLAKLDEENVMLKGSVENYSSENARLREEMTKVQSDFVDLQDSNQALKEQTHKLKAEIQKFATDASVKLEEMTFLKNELSDRDKFLNTLREQMAATNTAKQDLQLTLQQKDDSLKQQEMFIKQLQAKSVEGEGQMSQQMETITELQKEAQSLQAALQSKDMLLLEKERNLTCLKETLVSESDKSQSQVSSSNEIISKLQQELKVALETSNHLTEKISQLDLELKQKADECLTIKEHISSLEDSHSQIQTQMQNLTSECDHLKKTLTKKEQDILNMKSTSLACTTSLNEQLKAKESECDSLKEQLSGLNDTISKLNISLRAQSSEISSLQEAFKDSTDALLEQTKAVQDLQRKADESALFKAQFMESTELVAQLQDQIQELSMQSTHLKEMAEEKQSALMNLQEKYATHSEELHKCKTLLSQRDEEISNLQKALKDCSESSQAAENIANSLRHECALLQDEVQNLRTSSAELSKQKTDALSAHERNSSSLTVEIEMLKSQHVHVAAQVTALTENLEQREMALHAINSQYSAQVKHAEHLLLEVEKLTEQNRRLQEEFRLTEDDLKMKLNTEASEKEAFAEVAVKDKAELEKKYKNLIQKMEDQFQAQIQQQTCNMSETLKKMELEKEHLHAQLKETVSLKAENAELKDLRLKCDDQQRALHQTQAYRLQCEKDFTSYKAELAELRAEKSILLSEQRTWKSIQSSYPAKESVALLGKTDCSEHLAQPQRDLQSCVQEIHQREALLEQLNARLQQAVDEKNGVSSQLKAVSQTLRESQLNLNELQNRCYWLERQVQIQQAPTQRGSVSAEVAPGAPQEKSSSVVDIETTETQELRNRLSIAECQLASSQQIVSQLNDRLEDERARRLAAEEALGFTEERVKSMDATSSRSSLRDFSIQLETEDEWEALILDPNQHVLMRKVKGGVLSCKRWLRGRSLYCSKLLTTRAKSRYLFLSYLLILHVLVFMCLSGVL